MRLYQAVIKSKKLMIIMAFLGATVFSVFLFLLADNQKTFMMEADFLIWAVLFCFILTNNDEIELIRVTEKSIGQVIWANIFPVFTIALISEFFIRFFIYLAAPGGEPVSVFCKGYLSYAITLFFYSSIAVFCRMIWKNQYISLAFLMFVYVCQYILHLGVGSAYIDRLQGVGNGGMNDTVYGFLRLIDANIFSFWNEWTDIWWQNRLFFFLMGSILMTVGLQYARKHDISVK